MGDQLKDFGKAKGLYVLILYLRSEKHIEIGRLGVFCFPSGYYTYVGSAMGPGGMAARVRRHLRGGGAVRWHIDFLRKEADVVQVWLVPTKNKIECHLAKSLGRFKGSALPAAKFGSTDCLCPTHLFHFSLLPRMEEFSSMLKRGRRHHNEVRTLGLPAPSGMSRQNLTQVLNPD